VDSNPGAATKPPTEAFRLSSGSVSLSGESVGEGPPILLLHGLTATRRQVVHGSLVLPREGFRTIAYDARGHGDSDPSPPDAGYTYEALVADLGAVIAGRAGDNGRPVLVGHSMGCHTVVAYALEHAAELAGLVAMGPVYMGVYDDASLARWDELADGLEKGGIDGFLDANERGVEPAWRETVRRFTRERMEAHRDLAAVAEALRQIPRSEPFDSMSELEFLDVPTLVVASHDRADPRHPYAVAEAYAERIPGARMVSEAEGESPLVWQGGRLSREIAAFCTEPRILDRR
jgi:pimeloyl-ACP methyl ester carboxylesterase